MSWGLVFLALWMAFRLILLHAAPARTVSKPPSIPTVTISSEKR